MLKIKFITVGSLSESHWRAACEEYKKRLGGFASVTEVCIKEARLPSVPSDAQIAASLEAEGAKILENISPRSCVFAMCVEGKQLSSEKLAEKLASVSAEHSEVCFVIGSSHGLSDKVKTACDMRLSFSELTFPHQLLRVILLEAVYRAFNINAGTKYHK